jgi:hypothetical protein
MDKGELDLGRGVTRGKRSPPGMGRTFPYRMSKIFPIYVSRRAQSEWPTRLEVVMVRVSQSGQTNESNSACAGAARAYETDGGVVPTLHDRDNGNRAGTRTDESKSKLPKGVGKLTFVPIGALR